MTNKVDLRDLPKVINKKFYPLLKDGNRFLVFKGGAGSGKSVFCTQKIIFRILVEQDHKILVIRKVGRTLRDSVFALFKDTITQFNLEKNVDYIVNKSDMTIRFPYFNSEIIFKGLDDSEKIKSIAGITSVFVEEANEISETDLNQLNLRIRGKTKSYKQIMLAFNPISDLHWIKKRFFDIGEESATISQSTYRDNKFLDEQYKAEIEKLKDVDYQYYRIYALNEWGSLGNVIYTNWEKQDLSDIKDTFDNLYNAIDFGFADDPTAFIRVHLDKKKKIIYIVDEMYQRGMFIDDIAKEIKGIVGTEIVTCDSSEPRSIADLKRNGIRAIGAKKGAGSIEHGIKWLQGHKIVVDHRCTDIIKELSSYKWKEDKDGNVIPKPVDKDNHGLDALRYALEGEMRQSKTKIVKNFL